MKNIFSLSVSKIGVAALVLTSAMTATMTTMTSAAQAQTGASPLPKASPKVTPTPDATPTPEAVEAAPAAAPKAEPMVGGLVGQCRAMNKQTPLYKERSTTSEAVSLLKINDKVTLAEDAGASGLIAVSVPGKGFVMMANLKTCPGSKPPVKPPVQVTGSCRLVVQKQGLSIRKEPGAGEVVGGVAFNEKVTLVNPAEAKTATDGRDWMKIAKPTAGWVSEGFKDQAFKNLGACN